MIWNVLLLLEQASDTRELLAVDSYKDVVPHRAGNGNLDAIPILFPDLIRTLCTILQRLLIL